MNDAGDAPVTGGCRCGAVRYAVDLPGLPVAYACHCTLCQTWSGSGFSEQFYLPAARLSVTGEVVEYSFVNAMGRTSVQRFCPTCHVRIYNSNMALPGFVNVRAGTLDRSAELHVAIHMWVERRQPWLRLPDDALVFDGSPPLPELMKLVAANGTD